MSSVFVLTFSASPSCIGKFVDAAIHSRQAATVPLSPFGAYEADNFGWTFPPGCACRFYVDASSVERTVTVAIVALPNGDQTAFVEVEA